MAPRVRRKGLASDGEGGRLPRSVDSAAQVYAAMEGLLAWRVHLAAMVAEVEHRAEAMGLRNLLTTEPAKLRRFDAAVLTASKRPDGLVALAEGRGRLTERVEKRRAFLETYDWALASVANFLGAMDDQRAEHEAWCALMELPERGRRTRAQALALRAKMVEVCKKPPSTTNHGRPALIVESLTGVRAETAKTTRRRAKRLK